jgi:hypothetical protein
MSGIYASQAHLQPTLSTPPFQGRCAYSAELANMLQALIVELLQKEILSSLCFWLSNPFYMRV